MDNSIQAKLKRLFSTQVIVRRIGKDRIKVIDTSRLQGAGTKDKVGYADRFSGLHTSRQYGYSPNNNTINFHSSKLQIFTDYEAMDTDPIIASALDIYADESTVMSVEGDLLNISTPNENIKKILYNLFYDILNIDYNLWSWTRSLCKYGDFYLYLDIEEGLGIKNVIPLSAYEVRRMEGTNPENPYEVKFIYEGLHTTQMSPIVYRNDERKNKELDYHEVAHFRLLSDSNFLPYGRSQIEPARKIFKMLTLMEDAMLIHRIMRAPERRIFKINVGSIPPNEVDNYMSTIISSMKKTPYVDEKTGDYNLKFNLQNMLEDYYLPVRGKDASSEISTLPGLGNQGFMDDIEYVRNRMMAALKIPKPFLGYDKDTEGKSMIAAEDVRFARTIERIQKIIVSELNKIAIIHLYTQGYKNEELIDFSLSLNNPSLVYERQKVEILTEKMNLALVMQDSKLFSRKYIHENLFKLSESERLTEEELIIEDLMTTFRHSQIETEGNDPKLSGQSFGTPHDMMSLKLASKGNEIDPMSFDDGEELEFVDKEDNRGRPKRIGTFGTKDDKVNGRDSMGDRDMKSNLEGEKDPLKARKRENPVNLESKLVNSLRRQFDSHVGNKNLIIEKSFKENEKAAGTDLLSENNLLDLE